MDRQGASDNQRALEPQAAQRRPSRWYLLLSLALAVPLLYLALRNVEWAQFLRLVSSAQPAFLVAAFAGATFNYFVRALRWRVLLEAEQAVPRLTAFWGIAVGYLGNNFLPARAGELIRSALLARRTKVSTSYVLATALTERIVDALVLVTIALTLATFLGGLPDWLLSAAGVMAVLGILSLVGLFVAPRLRPLLVALLERLPVKASITARLVRVLDGFLLGMRALYGPRVLSFAALTVVVWTGETIIAVTVAHALGLELTPPQALLLLAALGLASAAPSTPGYVGIWQFVAVTVLAPFNFSASEAIAFIITFQAIAYLVATVWGGLGWWRLTAPT